MSARPKGAGVLRNHALILDDEGDSRNLIARIAMDAGFEVSLASKIDEFILQFSNNRPTFLILDVFLGDEHIESVFRFLRNQRFTEPVAMVSGYAIREMDVLVADALGKGILVACLFEKASMSVSLRHLLGIYHLGVKAAS